ncbi:unnamed protein product [Paramecium sonneborni]|uniref:R-spondin Fu-CRD domain-containing protein n=1 Tax=Paramecium sonneborni TaxID=65129 RepID=A0A8S1MRC8_9CILI|nr:unnamed protein product [Paramecium sonneborni]
MILLVLLITYTVNSQPYDTVCGTKKAIYYQEIVSVSNVIVGLGTTPASTNDYISLQPKLTNDANTFLFDGLDTFMINLWFRPARKQTNPGDSSETPKPEQAIFRISMDTSDETLITNQGVRLGMYYTADYTQTTQFIIRYAKSSTPNVMVNSPFPYLEEKWCFGSVALSYSKGKVVFYAFQPAAPNVIVNPMPITEVVGFHTSLTSLAVMQLLYWGSSYQYHYGQVRSISIFKDYIELDYKHNWFNIMFLDPTYSVSLFARYRLEEMTGQVVYNKIDMTQQGFLGTDNTVQASDPTWGIAIGLLQFASAQTVKLPAIIFGNTNTIFGIALWFRSTAVILGDADNVDLTKDLQIFKRNYQGTTEVLTLLFYQANAAQQGTKLKIGTTIFQPALILHQISVWHHITCTVLYPGSLPEQSQIIYDITLEKGIYQAHQTTSLSNSYQESPTDTIILGSGLNSFSSGNLQLSNINFFNKYTVYVDEDGADTNFLNCNADCQVSLNSFSSQICFICKSPLLMNEGNCVASCSSGANALSNPIGTIDLCRSCDFKCSSCIANGSCNACNTGYYLIQPAGNACVVSSSCGGNYVGNPATLMCTLCGNGKKEASEGCDEGFLVAVPIAAQGPGCINCVVTSPTYKCSGGTPTTKDICKLACGDGIWDAGEICDDGNNVDGDGCSADCSTIEDFYYCIPVGAPINCDKNCGNGKLESGAPDLEQCDIGGGSTGCTNCQVDIGYDCDNSNPLANPISNCTKLCGNGSINAGEDCDDQNNTSSDGCSDCVTDVGWICSGTPSVCSKMCGNGLRDQGEECDDGNGVNNDGCSNCKVDTDYVCSGGSDTTSDKCKAIPEICGDGIKKSTEECDDGNTLNGDGCSKQCKIEIGYSCMGITCSSICGDGIKIQNEKCDDGNVLGGDGCDEMCRIEKLYQCEGGSQAGRDQCILRCGDGIRDDSEQCDDNNVDDGDGCSQYCNIESGYGCIVQAQSHDQCFKCLSNCAICTSPNSCDTCLTMFYQLEQQCYPGCPSGYYPNNNICLQCGSNCSQCINQLTCVRCNYDHYLQNGKCYSHCPLGFSDQPNAMLGNQCIPCKSPCANCDTTTCYACIEKYYLDQETATCMPCNMGSECLKCDSQDGECLLCSDGYYRDGKTCTQIPFLCGDGLHHPQERCDDGNIIPLDGCDQLCKIELNWDCILYDPQGPDVCFLKAPPQITISWSLVYTNIIYIHFSRPMKQNIDYSNLTTIIIPDLEHLKFKEFEEVNDEGIIIQYNRANAFIPYEYSIIPFKNQTIQITFQFQITIQDLIANITFNNASSIQDIYNWSLINQTTQDRRFLQEIDSINSSLLISTPLPYYIYYTATEKDISIAVAYLLLILSIFGVLSGFYYYYRIGEGRIRKTIEFIQVISMLRYINIRMGYNLEQIFTVLDYFNLTFIPNVFDLITNDCDQSDAPSKFQYYNYNTQMLSEGGGRFLTAFGALLFILGINQIFYRFVPDPDIEYYAEQVHKYFRCQGLTIFIEIFFMDLILSIVLNLQYYDVSNVYGIINLALSILFAISIMVLIVLIIQKLIRNPHIIRVKQVYDYFGEFFDGLLFTTPYTKFFALVPYLQKIIIAIALVFLTVYPQIGLLVLIRLGFYSLSANVIPIYYIELFVREVCYDVSMTIITLTIFALDNDQSSKQQKMDVGWGISSLIVFTMGLQIFFVKYAISIIDRMIPPIMPDHEEIVQQEPDQGNKDLHILQQAVEMENLENEFFNNK